MKYIFSILCTLLFISCGTSEKPYNDDIGLTFSKPNYERKIPKAENEFVKAIKDVGTLVGDTQIFDQKADGYILVYAPTLSDMNAFEHPMHVASMFTYFENDDSLNIETITVSNEPKAVFDEFVTENEKNYPDFFKSLSFLHDLEGEIIEKLAIQKDDLLHGGIAILFSKKGREIFRQFDYKCQGEKLQRMYQFFYPRRMQFSKHNYQLEVGKKVPPQLAQYCSDYLGKKNMLITFYPAPLSHSCSIQMRTLSDMATQNLESKDLKVLAISIGNDAQVEAWKLHQPVKSIELKADVTGEISNAFNSILTDSYGVTYSDRTVFLIDKKGIVRYINQDYDVTADLDVLEQEILKL